MGGYIARRVLYSLIVLLIASFASFIFLRLTFDPTARLAQVRDPQAKIRERERLGIDEPLVVQYTNWLSDFATGDWGESWTKRESISDILRRAMGYTLQLIIPGFFIAAVLAIGVGVYSAVRQYSFGDHLFTGLSFIGISIPQFWFAFLAIQFMIFTLPGWLGIDPFLSFVGPGDGGLDSVKHLALPILVLIVQIVASWSRYQRASMLDVLSADYVRTARAKGVPRRKVIYKHAFRNALIPIVTVMAIDAGLLFGGLVITEQIFSIPGMGRVFIDALTAGDAPTLTAWVVVTSGFVVLFNLIADLLYGVLDPRVRLS